MQVLNSSAGHPFLENLTERLERIHSHCQNYKAPQISRSVSQLFLTLVLYLTTIVITMFSLMNGWLWIAPFSILFGAGMLIKLFIIQHDCGHGSYFKSATLNTRIGQCMSIFTLTPFAFWRDAHNKHHATSGNLSKRGIGAIDTLTKSEYDMLSDRDQFLYRFYRHPLMMFLIGPPLYIIIMQRFIIKNSMGLIPNYVSINGPHLAQSVIALNIGIVLVYGSLIWIFGAGLVLMTFLPISILAAITGGWLFYVQHQYENTYWAKDGEWDYKTAALLGSSHYDLPKVLHWVTGNIGFHHIHHLSSLIPNYRLAECYRASPDLQLFPKMSILESLKSIRLRLWDEADGRMTTM